MQAGENVLFLKKGMRVRMSFSFLFLFFGSHLQIVNQAHDQRIRRHCRIRRVIAHHRFRKRFHSKSEFGESVVDLIVRVQEPRVFEALFSKKREIETMLNRKFVLSRNVQQKKPSPQLGSPFSLSLSPHAQLATISTLHLCHSCHSCHTTCV